MNTLLLQPTDVLFFRDGRPMSGSLAGHTAAWPLPDVTNHALHAALHRAGLNGVHTHGRGRSGDYSDDPEHRDRKFGSLLTAGPFPVDGKDRWFFPRPRDAQGNGSVAVTLCPARLHAQAGNDHPWPGSSLPNPLKYAVANTRPPKKGAGGEPWISGAAFTAYLRGEPFQFKSEGKLGHYRSDADIADTEPQIGIGIDPETGSAAESQIYSAHYLRLREGFRLGVFAKAVDKDFQEQDGDLLKALVNGHPPQIVVGGQQRICTAELCELTELPLPRGLSQPAEFQQLPNGNFAVKWVLLAPAIWPEIPARTSKRGTETRSHPGGWLPNWICPETGAVLLRIVDKDERSQRRRLNYQGMGYKTDAGNAAEIPARLVAAVVPKPLVVTGWALPNAADPERGEDGGAKSTHLSVPAGAVYYFEADWPEAAVALASALNWHGVAPREGTRPTGVGATPVGVKIKNRRSTLLGEKGYGLGVCGTWQLFGDVG
jgi:hypothetical protein